MKRVHILVEGQTEETFVKNLLQEHFWSIKIDLNPVIITTKKQKSGKEFKGGVTSYQKIKNHIQKLLNDTNASAITTMLDYYGLPSDFPGYNSLPTGTCYERVFHLTQEFQKDINDPRFFPFLTLHEFEAFLFVSPEQIVKKFPSYNILNELIKIRSKFTSPEEINDGLDTHPSARIQTLISSYKKATDGLIITERIGLELIRAECRHFDKWLKLLESF